MATNTITCVSDAENNLEAPHGPSTSVEILNQNLHILQKIVINRAFTVPDIELLEVCQHVPSRKATLYIPEMFQ